VRLKHLLCAARELPFSPEEITALPAADRELMAELRRRELLVPVPLAGGAEALAYPKDRLDIHVRLSLRSAGQATYHIIDENRNEIGPIEPPTGFREAHPGAIYQHGGDDYRVTHLDRHAHTVHVRPEHALHYTRASSGSNIKIERIYAAYSAGGGYSGAALTVAVGDVLVEETIYGYQELQLGSDAMVKRVNLDAPLSIRLHTTATWITLSPELAEEVRRAAAERAARDAQGGLAAEADLDEGGDPLEAGLHAVQHLLTGVMPLLVMCDRRDVDGFYHVAHPDLAGPAVFVYDAYEGGIGLAEVAYSRAEALLRLAHETVASCTCHSGCPSCIQSGSCRLHNERLDKALATDILAAAQAPAADVTEAAEGLRSAAENLAVQGPEGAASLNRERALEELLESTRRKGLVSRLAAAKAAEEADAPEPASPAEAEPATLRYAPGDHVEMSPYGRGVVLSSRQAAGHELVTVRWIHRGRIKEVDATALHKIG
jgi:DEAD/DEAH box helicase domain-containing protein